MLDNRPRGRMRSRLRALEPRGDSIESARFHCDGLKVLERGAGEFFQSARGRTA